MNSEKRIVGAGTDYPLNTSREYKAERHILEPLIEKADYSDLKTILDLQYIAYQSEADLFGSRDIPPLKQTLEEVIREYNAGIIDILYCSVMMMTDLA